MTIIRAIAFLLHFTLVPVAVGRLISYKDKKFSNDGFSATYFVGWFASLGIFYVLCSVLEWHQYWNTFTEPFTGCFTALCISYSVIIAVLCLLWIKRDWQTIKALPLQVKDLVEKARTYLLAQNKEKWFLLFYGFVFLIILVIQIYFAYGYQIGVWSYDDYDYVVNSQDTITTDTIAYANYITGDMPFTADKRAVTAWPTYVAYLAKLSGFEVATVCHTIMPVILLLVAYYAFYYMSTLMFKDVENRLIFMDILAFTYMFGLYSHNSMTFRLLGAIWQGKAVLSIIAIPFFMVYLFTAYSEEVSNKKLLPLALVSLGISSLSSMSLVLLPILSLGIFCLMCIYNRRIYGMRYLLASLFGCIYIYVFYRLMTMLLSDMSGGSPKYFTRGRDTNWWYRWFGTNF